jgi:hypothetical protein
MSTPIMTWSTARDAIFGVVNDTWNANDTSIFGGTRKLRFQDVEERETQDQEESWGYCYMQVLNTRQAGLRNDQTRRYRTVGVVTVEVYASRHAGRAATKARLMADKIRRALEGTRSGGVWYRNVTASPAGQTAGFVVSRVMADFEYTEEGESDAQ